MNSWLGYKARFAELSTSGTVMLELQFGEGTENWTLEGGSESARQALLTLSRAAGKSLLAVHLVDHETGSIGDPEVRWFRLLRERNRPEDSDPVLIDQVGVALYHWHLEDMAHHSAELSLDLYRSNPIQKEPGWLLRKLKDDLPGTIVKAACALAIFVLMVLLGVR